MALMNRIMALVVILLTMAVLGGASSAVALVRIDQYGNIIQGRVLSSGSEGSGENRSGSGSGEDKADDNGRDEEGDSGSSGSSGKTKTETEVRKDGEVRTEVRLPDGTKIKTRVEEGRTRTDVYRGATKVRFEREGDRFRIKAENDLGQEIKLEERVDDALDEEENKAAGKAILEDALETEDEIVVEERADLLRIRALRSKAIIERLNVQALTALPLSVDLNTNILTVTTPAGERQVTVLPDQAVQNMLAANAIDRLYGQALVDEVRRGNIETLGQVVELGLRNDVPVYQVQGVKDHRFLGFWPVTTSVTVAVSAETGEVVAADQSFGDKVIDFFSRSV